MILGKRAQGSVQYLVTYGFVIMAVIAVVAILFSEGILSGGLSKQNICVPQSGFVCGTPLLTTNGTLTVNMQELGQAITINGIACTNTTAVSYNSFSTLLNPISLYSGQNYNLVFSCPVVKGSIGNQFTGFLWIEYNNQYGQQNVVQKLGSVKAVIRAGSAAFNSLASHYVDLKILNTQQTGTGQNFQQMVTFNPSVFTQYEANDLGNIRFYNSNASITGANELYSWCESGCSNKSTSAVFWVKLPNGVGVVSKNNVKITLTNAQSVAVGGAFQQEIWFNPSSYIAYESSDLGNIRFYQGSTELYSWCQTGCSLFSTNTIFWIALPGGIAANSNTVINMTFLPKGTEYDGVYAGEASLVTVPTAAPGSTPIVSYASGAITGGTSITVTTPGVGSTFWLCGAAEGYPSHPVTTSYTVDVFDHGGDDAYVGHQNTNGCTASDDGRWAGVAIGVANTIIPYQITSLNSGTACGGQCKTMAFPITVTTNSFVAIIITCGGDYLYGGDGACGSSNISGMPGGCGLSQDETSDSAESADLYICNSISGTFTVNIQSYQQTDTVDMAAAAYIFPNYTITSGVRSYPKYDNGANVFPLYFNMSYNPLTYSSSAGLGTWSNTITQGPTEANQPALVLTGYSGGAEFAASRNGTTFPSNFIIDSDSRVTTASGQEMGLGASIVGTQATGYYTDPDDYGNTELSINKVAGATPTALGSITYHSSSNTWYSTEFSYLSNGLVTGYIAPFQNNLDLSGSTNKVSSVDNSYTSFRSIIFRPYMAISTQNISYGFALVRAYPPNGVMPAASFNSVSGSSNIVNVAYVNMTFMGTNTEYDGVYAGESPVQSINYAKYDNGASVFPVYYNFYGVSGSLPSGLFEGDSSGAFTISNGISLNSGASAWLSVWTTTKYNPMVYALELYAQYQAVTNNKDVRAPVWEALQSVPSSKSEYSIADNSGNFGLLNWNGAGSNVANMKTDDSSFHVFSVWETLTQSSAQIDYGSATVNSGYFSSNTAVYAGFATSSPAGASLLVKYMRLRISPPNGVMPTVTFQTFH